MPISRTDLCKPYNAACERRFCPTNIFHSKHNLCISQLYLRTFAQSPIVITSTTSKRIPILVSGFFTSGIFGLFCKGCTTGYVWACSPTPYWSSRPKTALSLFFQPCHEACGRRVGETERTKSRTSRKTGRSSEETRDREKQGEATVAVPTAHVMSAATSTLDA